MVFVHELLEGVGESLLGTHFTCFTGTNVQNAGAECAACASLHPLDVEEHFLFDICVCMLGTHFTCFVSTEVQILTPEELASLHLFDVEEHFLTCTQFTFFTGTKGLALLTTKVLASLRPLDVEEHFLKVARAKGTHFTFFTSTQVQILTQQALLAGSGWQRASYVC